LISTGKLKVKGIFDASSLVNLAINGGSKATEAISGGSGIVLTFYEIGNSIWRLHRLLGRLSRDQAGSLLEVSLELFGRLNILNLVESDGLQILQMASVSRLTFYDASYLYAAKRSELVLVTDDARLGKAARQEKVETASSASIL